MFPIHLKLASIFIPFYEGLYFFISIALGLVLGLRTLRKQGYDEDEYMNIIFWGILGAMIGGRLFHVIFWGGDYYLRNPLKIFIVWEGGISITGGLAGAFAAAFIVCRRTHASFTGYLSILSPVILTSQGIGRLGCFLNGDAFGLPSGLPWAVRFRRFGTDLFTFRPNTSVSSPAWSWCYRNGLAAADSTMTVPMHPAQLYEAFFDFLLAFFLFRLLAKRRAGANVPVKVAGYIFLAGYGLFRFLVEYIRGDREEIILWNTSLIQFVLLLVALVFTILTAIEFRNAGRKNEGTD